MSLARMRHNDASHELVMSTAREMLKDHGYDDLTIAELARRSGVATKTLYNRYHSKHAVLAAAIEQILHEMLAPAERGDRATGIDGLLDLLNHVVDCLLRDPVLQKRAAYITISHPNILLDGEISFHYYRPFFREISARNELQPWADVDRVTRSLFLSIVSPYFLWATGTISSEQLRDQFMLFASGLLVPLTTGYTLEKLRNVQLGACHQLMASAAQREAAAS